MSGRETNLTKNMSYDRILKLAPIEGQTMSHTDGKPDKRLFTGEQELHARMDPEYGHWYLQYKMGTPPLSLQQRWTSFPRLVKAVEEYFKRRNIQISEIVDT